MKTLNLHQNQIFTLLSLVTLFTLSACTSTQKMINQGRYDAAISKSTRKLSHKKQKQKYILELEEAFKKATGRDMAVVVAKMQSDRISDLEDVLSIGYKIKSRQNKVEPFLGVNAYETGYDPSFQFVKINQIIASIEERLLGRYIDEGKTLLALGEAGNKSSARKAYDYFSRAKGLTENPKIYTYLDSAHYFGKTRILVDIENVSGDWIGYYVDNHLNLDIYGMNSFWTEYYLGVAEGPIDFKVDAVIQDIDISPERLSERIYEDNKEIEDGYEYVLDQNGNVLKDTLGNDVKTAKKVWINAQIIEVLQEKDLAIRGSLDIFDHQGRLLDTRPFDVIEQFENYSSTFKGNRRALSKESKRKIGNSPQPFPTDRDMVLEALKKLSPAIHDQLRRRNWAI